MPGKESLISYDKWTFYYIKNDRNKCDNS